MVHRATGFVFDWGTVPAGTPGLAAREGLPPWSTVSLSRMRSPAMRNFSGGDKANRTLFNAF
jgi:hypothetical protein